jgi:hypothetical protein
MYHRIEPAQHSLNLTLRRFFATRSGTSAVSLSRDLDASDAERDGGFLNNNGLVLLNFHS